jgi:hypothetical protein
MNHKIPWSSDEISLLKRIYPTSPWDDIDRLFPNRSRNAVKLKAKRLNLVRDHRKNSPAQTPLTEGTISKFDMGWLIGLIEGEGTVSIESDRAYRIPCIQISNSETDILKHAQFLMGGHLSSYGQKNPKWRDRKLVTMSRIIDVRNALKKLLPFFINERKKLLATLVLFFAELKLSRHFKDKPHEMEEMCYRLVRELNRRDLNSEQSEGTIRHAYDFIRSRGLPVHES